MKTPKKVTLELIQQTCPEGKGYRLHASLKSND